MVFLTEKEAHTKDDNRQEETGSDSGKNMTEDMFLFSVYMKGALVFEERRREVKRNVSEHAICLDRTVFV